MVAGIAHATAPTASGVSITGTTEVGFQLTGTYTYNDIDGDLESGTTFRWLRNGSPIALATSTTYTLVPADQGAFIVFEVTPGDGTLDSPGVPVQSAPVGPIAAANTAPTATAVSISGTTEVGFQLTGSYTYNDADGDPESGTTFRWLRNGSPISLATSTTYTLVPADQGASIVFEVTPRAASGVTPGTAVPSAPVGPIAAANTAPTATSVSISGTPEVGQTLSGSYTYNDADGDPESGTTFRWLRNGAQIGGATSQTYTLVSADEGRTIVFEVTPRAASGVTPGTAVQSAPVGPIAAANTAPTATAVSISGTTEVGFQLSGSYTYNDADGDLESGTTFRWLRNGSPIAGATGQQYTLQGVDEGAQIRFEVTPRAATGVTTGSAVQSAPVTISAANTAPTATSVSISGTPEVGLTLSGSYTYNDADGDLESGTTFRWLRNGIAIGGATSQTYTLVSADQGTSIVFEVTPRAASGVTPGTAVQSAPVGPIAAANTAPTATAVSISGTTEVGFVLTGNYTYNDADGDLESGTTFRWLRNGSPIPGAASTTYTLVTADQGTSIVFEVTPRAASGVTPGTPVQSAPVGPIAAANTAPTATNVSITGTPQVGEFLTGVYTYNDADGDPEGTSRFRWLRNGATIPGANTRDYLVDLADKETTLQFEVTPVAQTGVTQGNPVLSAGRLISNSAPSIFGQNPVEMLEDTSREIVLADLIVNDLDDNNCQTTADCTLSVLDGTNYTRVDNTITPVLNFDQVLTVPVRVNDGTSNSDVFNLSVTVTPVNDAPAFVGVLLPGLSTPEDTTLTIPVSALEISDPDNLPADFVLTLDPALPPDANYTLAGPASITPAENFNGDLSVRATVSDGELSSAPFLIPVTVTAENDLPVLVAEIGPQNAIENSLFTLNVFGNFSDADGDALTFSATGLPVSGSITIDPASGVLSGTPSVQDARDNEPYIVTVTATDPLAASVSDEFELTVSALDRANINLSIGVTPESGLPNDQLTWTFTAANPIGPAPGENVELTGSFFGDGLSVAAGGGSGCSITVQTGRANFVCTIGALPVGGTASVNFTTTANQATEVVAFGTAAGAQLVPIDPNISDNSAVRAVGVAESFSDGAVQFLGSETIRSIAAGDFDGDGTIDLVVGTAAGQPVQVYLGDEPRESCGCQRDFVTTPISIPDTGANEGIAVADFDSDGNLDLVIANGGGQPDAVYRNTGAANFVLSALLAPSNGRDVAVGDFNNDGNPDIAIAATSPNPVYFGDGAGGFGAGILLGDVESFDVAVGRFDDDLFDDLVFANVGSDSQVWLNNGGTGFTPGALLQIGDTVSVAAMDLNGDNLGDLVFGRIAGGSDDVPANPVLINQGGGTFGGTPQLLGISPTVDVLIGDVSDDGVPDLVFVNESGVHQIWTASGGSFVLHSEQIIDIGARAGVLANLGFADTDDPGGADLALGGALSAGAAVYLNDSAGNLGLGDAVAPVITLNGAASVDVPSGTAYTDAGATADDNIDGDVSSRIVISNPVNSAAVGSYTVTYNVQDSAGNAAVQVTRTVNVTAAVGRGGGGGGATGYWALALLLAMQGLVLVRSRVH